MDVLKQIRNDFFGEDYKKYILIGFQKYFENQTPMSVKEKEKLLNWLDEKSHGHVVLSLGSLNENGELRYWNGKKLCNPASTKKYNEKYRKENKEYYQQRCNKKYYR